ncbi:DUF1684 domain-containing protein [Pseudoxanthomonas sp. SL93]|uniref:DUF1684 domain-containing protein n=1 Tax=Pseudoxanthomonas sp. SL93 TaxID=2995142 RepID=UPI0022720844|nr:DUF1684 domain-containing protein [Pseudoxanthomonas sp. SL93]WAC65050.1 DUF1684 domain-containing protein [Pseudoxanthomonas sp. SL93]
MAALAGCQQAGEDDNRTGKVMDARFLADNATWREQRKLELVAPDGWTSLVGLHWIELKSHFIGNGPSSGIKLLVGPPKLGMVAQRDGRIFFTPESGVAVTLNGEPVTGRVELQSDRDASPGVIGFDEGKGALSLIERGGRHALRVKHADAESRIKFVGLDYWPADENWRIEGRFIPHPPGKTLTIIDVIGVATESPNPGAVEFERDGKPYRLEALGQAGGPLFFVLADRTSGHGSYPAGRFLDAAAPVNGKVVLDFNRAYNPPCVFTPYATCPLPPAENRLDLRVDAGEKTYAKPIKVL